MLIVRSHDPNTRRTRLARRDTTTAVVVCAAVLLAACATNAPSVSTSPPMPPAPATSAAGVNEQFAALVAARARSESGWAAYAAEQAVCLPLKHRRGDVDSFTACYPGYTAAFRRVVALSVDYARFLETYEAPATAASELAAYRAAVAAATTRLAAMYEVFCSDQPHSELDWYNCVGSNDVSEYWERYFQLRGAVATTEDTLAASFVDMGLLDLRSP